MSLVALRPTFSESWYRVAALKIRLRPGAQITRQYHRGERWYVIRDPAANQFMRLSDGAYQFIGLLDGKRSVAEAWELAGGQMDDAAPTQPEVIQILSQLHAANLVEADISPDAEVLLRRHKAMQRRQWQQRAMNLLFPRIPLPFDLNGIVTRWMPLARVLFSKFGLVLWVTVVIAALAALAPHWKALGAQTSEALQYQNWVYLWAVFVFTKVIHEFGHAFACRKFGGEVHEMGIMFLVFIPTPYVDASTAWGFPSRWQRMFVGAAGMFTELFFAALMSFVWLMTNSQTSPILNAMAYNAMLVASVSTVLFNANPLLRYDGYYMLSDFLEIPNLQQKSKDYGWGIIKRHVFRIKQTQPLPPVKQRVWMFAYWVLSSIYRVFVGVMIILLVSGNVPVLGVLMALGGVVTWCVVPVVKLGRYLTIEPELHRKRGRAWAFTGAVATVLILTLGIIKVPVWVWSEAILEPRHREVLRAEYDGYVSDIAARDEQLVKAGQVIVEMRNPELASQIVQLQASLAASQMRRQLAIATDQTQRVIEEENIAALQQQLEILKKREAELTVRAPFDGRLVSPRLHELQGVYMKRGQEFAIIATIDQLEARAVVEQSDATRVEVLRKRALTMGPDEYDKETEIRLAGAIDRILNPVGPPMVPAAAQEQLPHPSISSAGGGKSIADPRDEKRVRPVSEPFEVVLQIDNSDLQIMPGQRANIRFTVGEAPIISQVWRRLQQMFQLQNLGSKWS